MNAREALTQRLPFLIQGYAPQKRMIVQTPEDML
jgi:hypothetical protein